MTNQTITEAVTLTLDGSKSKVVFSDDSQIARIERHLGIVKAPDRYRVMGRLFDAMQVLANSTYVKTTFWTNGQCVQLVAKAGV